MEKTIFLAIFDKFFSSLLKLRSSKKFRQIAQKNGFFFIFKVISFFNDLCPFLIFKLNIIKKFELWQKLKYAQTLVLYSSPNIELFMKILIIWNYFGGFDFLSLFFEIFVDLMTVIGVICWKNTSCHTFLIFIQL